MSEPLVSIRNHHAPTCGDPPIVYEDGRDVYVGYFENQHAEQWIFICDRSTGDACLLGGDVGWNKPHQVIDGTVQGLMLNSIERLWLQACWAACS